MGISVGQAVRGENFWDRKNELQDIWDAVENSSHVLISAPRRVGKTSIMYKVLDEPKLNYIPIYIDTESADSENEFWQKLFHALREEEFVNKLESFAKTFWTKLKNIKIEKISATGVVFGDGEVLDYKEAFKRLVKDLDNDKKIIIMIDEFAQTVENIIKYEDEKHALSLLKTHRELRQDSKIPSKVIFIYAGSIGLESVVAKMGATKHINDLNSVKVLPLDKDEAVEFINKLCGENDLQIDTTEILYLLEKIEWLIPFYIQLILQEIKKLSRKNSLVTHELIDNAIHNALEHRNHFENWLSKLKEAFEKETYLFAKEVLNKISNKQTLNYNKIINLSVKHKVEEEIAREVIHSLIYDGYINNNEDPKIYRFNSPILRMW
jgi:hypothetical protein